MPQSSQDLGYGQEGTEAFSEAKSITGWEEGRWYFQSPFTSARSTTQSFIWFWIHVLGRSPGPSLTSPESLKEGVGGKDLLPLRKESWDPD